MILLSLLLALCAYATPAPLLASINQPFVMQGLNTASITIITDSLYNTSTNSLYPYNVKVQSWFQPLSSISITVWKNRSIAYTSALPSPSQTAEQFKVNLLASMSDQVSVSVSSSLSTDSIPNTVKSIVTFGQGS